MSCALLFSYDQLQELYIVVGLFSSQSTLGLQVFPSTFSSIGSCLRMNGAAEYARFVIRFLVDGSISDE